MAGAHAGRRDFALSLIRLAYIKQDAEVAGKALDFSAVTIEQRWSAGRRAWMQVVTGIEAGALSIAVPGLNVVDVGPVGTSG